MDSFWKWFVRGSKEGPRGVLNIFNWFLLIHAGIGFFCTFLIIGDPISFAQKALFPASSVLIGLSMAWTTRALTILQTKELRDILFNDERPAEDYIYGFQLAIFVVMTMIAYVAIMAGGGLNITVFGLKYDQISSKFWMYFLISLTMRECWGVINATNMLSMLEYLRAK